MIANYEFIDANPAGEKERKLTATTELYNKLSAEETNNFKDKLNEVIGKVNEVSGLAPFNTFKFLQKGFGNIDLNNFQIGDIFSGWSNDGLIRYTEARWLGGALTNSDNFEPIFTNSRIFLPGQLLIYKTDGYASETDLEVGDYVIAIIENQKIEGRYLGPNPLLLSSYNIYQQQIL
jgi:hypothetical protein